MDHRVVLGKISTSDGQKSAFTVIPGRWVGKSSSVKIDKCLVVLRFYLSSPKGGSFLILLQLRGVGNTIGCPLRELDAGLAFFFLFEFKSPMSYISDS